MWMYEALVLTSFGRLWKAKHLMDLLQVIVKSLFAQCHPCIIIIKSLSGPNSKTTEVAGVIYGNFSMNNEMERRSVQVLAMLRLYVNIIT